ncbi:CPBP family intramembrane glutamic endopeptidase [Sulfitobacter sp. HNIBRBA3233]|uniref:CPBP family intramembrane glutamic endopeptidase n=1 Tax=Sulfitobacter marinivivus TaxID=3158558 RepID=UPI0032DF2AD2
MRALLPDYAMHALHTRAAQGTAQIWRVLLAIVLMVAAYISLSLVYREGLFALITLTPSLQEELGTGSSARAMYLILLNFAVITASVAIAVRVVHRRPAISVLGPLALLVPHFARVMGILVVLGLVVMVLPPYEIGGALVPHMAPGKWALLLPVSLIAVFIQISAEEVLFRGYLQQQLGARFRSALVWMVLPSALFAIGHYQPAEAGGNAWIIVVWAFVFGMLMADLTARAGNIGPALAVHFVNNVGALLITSLPDTLSGLALFHTPFGMDDEAALMAWMPVDFAMMLCMWLAARLALRR